MAKAKKKTRKELLEEREVMYQTNNFTDERKQLFEKQIKMILGNPKWRKMWNVGVGTPAELGNRILKEFFDKQGEHDTKQQRRMDTLNKHRERFKSLFKIDLTRFFTYNLGFDTIRFDSHIQTPDNKSTADYVKELHGDSALEMLKELVAA